MVDGKARLKAVRTKLRAQVLEAENHYELMGLPPGADLDTIKATHRYLASAFHPDRCDLPDAADLMARVNVAYTCLTDKEARRKHDLLHQVAKDKCPTCRGSGSVLKQKGFARKVQAVCPECGGTGCR